MEEQLLKMSNKGILLGIMWLVVAAIGIAWIYEMHTDKLALDEAERKLAIAEGEYNAAVGEFNQMLANPTAP
jgi:hypothetical protein